MRNGTQPKTALTEAVGQVLTLTSRNRLAYAYMSAGRLEQAIRLHEQTAADRERILGPGHPETLVSRDHLARDYRSAGRLDEAIRLHEQNLADGERVMGADHPRTLLARDRLAGAYQSAGRVGRTRRSRFTRRHRRTGSGFSAPTILAP